MQFTLSMKGHEYEKENVTLHFSGMEPANVTFYTNSIKDDDKNHGVHVEKQLDVTNLDQVILLLTNNYYDISAWERLCLSLGLYKHTLNTIQIEKKNDVFSALIECLHKWLLRNDKVDDKGGPTLTSLKNALRENGQKAVAENIMKF
ncbi:PREDICTED: uncharacterized protein LOC109581876 [Amphimedon queenslandica]|uniref:Death domain-containing protein n=1 Tax=Amphimedon queenslandica TaxID=400682 RepID=A0AAN0J4I2_AMPQE|nr:PREDICTED: uncharacterized protein LOC109581876 [Amphimedon queenslandica]|eukprot:XP_019851910.1 PREDICTED: uncharacterized protein LOC109581876 [Amphimedon queenslandica]